MSTSLPKYVGWPDHWSSYPLWSLFFREKNLGHPNEEVLSVYRDLGVVSKDGRLDNHNRSAEDKGIYQLVGENWLVVNRMKAWQGGVGISDRRGVVSGHYLTFRPIHDHDSAFLNWLLRSDIYVTEYARRSRGVRPGQIEIDNDDLKTLPVAIPPLEEQTRISSFLRAECEKIDRLIDARIKISQLLQERIKSRVAQVIGDSSIVKQGGQPCFPVKRFLSKVRRNVFVDGEVVTSYRDGQVTARSLRRTQGYTESADDGPRGQGVLVGDIVIHGLDGFAGSIGDSEVRGNCSTVYHVCTVRKTDDSSIAYSQLLRGLAVGEYLGLFASSTRQRAIDFRNWQLFGSIPIPAISKTDQRLIEEDVLTLRETRDDVEKFLNLLAERRKSLITAAVAGRLDVATMRGVEV